jgi:hypothetical protein
MKCDISLRINPWRRIIEAALYIAFGLVIISHAYAADTSSDLSKGIPSGYLAETRGNVRWVFQESTRAEMQKLQKIQEAAWTKIRSDFGNIVDSTMEIRIAINPEQMQTLAPKDRRLPAYATGVAFPKLGLILLTLTAPQSWEPVDIETVLVHELSHLALDRAVNGASLPRWFSEGVAVYHSHEESFARTKTLWEGSLQSRLIPLERLAETFPARDYQVNLAYAQSADFVAFLLEGEDNQYRFSHLLKDLREGMTFSEAIANAYHLPLGYLEREWLKSLQQRFGRWPLLLTGMSTLWVLACVLLFVAYLQMKRKQKATLKRWAIEEAKVAQTPPLVPQPSEAQKRIAAIVNDVQPQTADRASIPTIEYEGQHYTVH